ncbi:nuclear transition protein 2-like [Sorex fumeus]|uniref:nuclear transition protein 2-like n=1 Tax=Sorex fumeus TaxID=62283 RepID=UPI0024ACD393|nr:nuclear transition protein 2-like [Sorex fumeus]
MDTKTEAHSATRAQSHACHWCSCSRCSQSRGQSPSPAGHRSGAPGSQSARRKRTMRAPRSSAAARAGAHSSPCPRYKRQEERKAKRWRRKAAERSRCAHQARRQGKGWK